MNMSTPSEGAVSKLDKLNVFQGNFQAENHSLSQNIRIYISSEYTDTSIEKAYIVEHVLPQLHSHCRSLGLQFYGINLFDSIPASCYPALTQERDITLDEEPSKKLESLQEKSAIYQLEKEGVLSLAIKEIKICQNVSAGPSFITLLGQKYGHKPLHTHILQEDFELIHAAIEDSSSRFLVQQWYILDTNAEPPEYVLQAWDSETISLSQWIDIHSSLSRTVRKAAKVALGKDVSKVQHFIMSAIEEEITTGIFKLKKNPNQCCYWFKRVFTDLLDQRLTDPLLMTYADMVVGKRGAIEFDSESMKTLNHLKEARLPAKYVGLDSTNIFEFSLKWEKGKGLNPKENTAHNEYLIEFGHTMAELLKQKIDDVSATLDYDRVYQEVLCHNVYCKKKAKTFMDRPGITEAMLSYITSTSTVPLVLYGPMGSGKTHLMAGMAHELRKKLPLQKMILITRFIGITPHSYSIRNTIKSICEQICTIFEEDTHYFPGDFTAYFKELLRRGTSERPIYIFLDGVDELSPEDGASGMSWLPLDLPNHVKIVLSTSSEIRYRCYPSLQSLLAKYPDKLIEVPALNKEECKEFLTHHQLRLRGRKLTKDQETATMMVLLRCPLPLYMNFIMMEVLEWKSYIGSKPWEIAAPPTTLHDMTEKKFRELEDEFGELFFSHAAGYISASKYGLTEMEILEILSVDIQVMEYVNKKWKKRTDFQTEDKELNVKLDSMPPLLWSQFRHKLLALNLVEECVGSGGFQVFRWSHKYLAEFAFSRYLSSINHLRFIYESLANYFSGHAVAESAENDSLHQYNTSEVSSQPLFLNTEKNIYNVRKLSELPFCLAKSGRRSELHNLLTNYHWLKGRIYTSSCAEVVEDFAAVLPVVPIQRNERDGSAIYELRLLRDALRLSIEVLNTDPGQLSAQICGRLLPFMIESDVKRPILEQLIVAALEDPYPLITPLDNLQNLPGGPLLVTMKGHRDAISCLATTLMKSEETGEARLCIISSSWDKTLKSWDLTTTGVLKTFDGHTKKVLSVAVTEDGQYAASGSADMTTRLWFVPTAHCVHILKGHTAAVNAVVMTTDGSKTISGSSDGAIKVWNTDMTSSSCGVLIFTIKDHRSPVLSLAFTCDQLLVSGAKNGVVLITDIVSSCVLHVFKGHRTNGSITALSTASIESTKYVLIGDQCGNVSIREMDSGSLVRSLHDPDATGSYVTGVVATHQGKVVVSHENRLLSVWQLQTGHHLYNFIDHHDIMLGIALADQDNLVITGSKDSSLHIWDLLSPISPRYSQHNGSTTSVSISPCGNYGISGGDDTKLKIYDLEKTSVEMEIDSGLDGVTKILVLRDSEHILASSCKGQMKLWNVIDEKLVLTLEGDGGSAVNCMAVSSDGDLLMSGGEDSKVVFWSLKTGAKLKTFDNHSTAVVSVGFSRNYMISASRCGAVCVRDYRTAKVVATSTTHTSDLLDMSVSPNAAFYVTGSKDRTCHVVDLQTGRLKCILGKHKGSVTCVKVLSNCTHCLTGSEDSYLRIWDTGKGDCVGKLCTDAIVTSCDISWKNDFILYGTKEGRVASAMYETKERAKGLIMRKLQGVTTPSDISSIEYS